MFQFQLHKEAADILRDLLQSVINEKVQESLRLQVRKISFVDDENVSKSENHCKRMFRDLWQIKHHRYRQGCITYDPRANCGLQLLFILAIRLVGLIENPLIDILPPGTPSPVFPSS
jgi:hypothetical protein